jgi:hypothetical protein
MMGEVETARSGKDHGVVDACHSSMGNSVRPMVMSVASRVWDDRALCSYCKEEWMLQGMLQGL